MSKTVNKTQTWGDNKIRWCSICGMDFRGLGNNAEPVNDGRCCDTCNQQVVVTRRINDSMTAEARKES